MTAARVLALVEAAGARLAGPSPSGAAIRDRGPSEIVRFQLRMDGGITIIRASGRADRLSKSDDLSAQLPADDLNLHREKTAELLNALGQLVPGGKLRAGVTYFRRRTEALPAFTEDGR